MDLEPLKSRGVAEIDAYRREYSSGLIGRPWPDEKVQAQLREFRSALIEPYWADVVRRDTAKQVRMTNPPVSRCAIVADDGEGVLLAFDPVVPEFLLVQHHEGALRSFGVNGDAVGCFMAR